jgi:transglycosylase-like protein/putative peptidoglycan binding protein
VGTDRDLGSPLPWRRSLRASHARRGAQARRRRRLVRGRAGVTLAIATMAVAAAGAVAQDAPPSGGAGGTGATSDAAGGSVAAIQRALGITPDGVYGPKTRAAVRRFQRREGLAVDGIAGPATLAALGLSSGSDKGDGGTTEQVSDTSASDGSSGSSTATLDRIARCESGGDPTAVSADGRYRGKYQFDRATWERMGGSGDPADATEAEQDRIAAKLLAQRGTTPWPACG